MKRDLDGQKYYGERWEAFLRDALKQAPDDWKESLIDVLDTADAVSRWLDSQGIPFLAADLVALTAIVVNQRASSANHKNPKNNRS